MSISLDFSSPSMGKVLRLFSLILHHLSRILLVLIFRTCSHRQLVSSYKGKFGYVHYYVKAQMERPHQPTLECKKSFEVEEPLDVNTPDLLVSSRKLNNRKNFYMSSYQLFFFSFLYSGSDIPNIVNSIVCYAIMTLSCLSLTCL